VNSSKILSLAREALTVVLVSAAFDIFGIVENSQSL